MNTMRADESALVDRNPTLITNDTVTHDTVTHDWLVDDSLRPTTEGELAPFYAAAASGSLALPFCGACAATPLELDQTACDVCASHAIVWREVELRGVVHAQTTVHRLEPGLIRTTTPYHVIDVELPSGHRLLMTTTTPVTEAPAIGTAVTIAFRLIDGVAVPAVDTSRFSSI